MPFSVLSYLLFVERHRQRITRSVMAAGFATPALGEIDLGSGDEGPLLATNMRGTFLLTRKSQENVARYGFTSCSVDEEGVLVSQLARVLWEMAESNSWGIRCRAVAEAVEGMRAGGHEPRTLVVSSHYARRILGPTAPSEGLAGTADKMRVLVTNLPENTALVALPPSRTGFCVRVGDSVGMLIRPQAFRVVQT